MTRGGRSMLPAPGFVVEPGDTVLVSATHDGFDALRARLDGDA